jgi:ankyrin repeat protein
MCLNCFDGFAPAPTPLRCGAQRAKPNLAARDRRSPLRIALEMGSLAAAEDLLKHGANTDQVSHALSHVATFCTRC